MQITQKLKKVLTGAALAGALLVAAPHTARAQRIGFGVTIGRPYQGGYRGYGSYGGYRGYGSYRPYGGYGYRPYAYGYGYPGYVVPPPVAYGYPGYYHRRYYGRPYGYYGPRY